MNELERQLHKLYGGQSLQRDVWGRRQATPKEIEQALDQNPEFATAWLGFLPDEEDLEEKESGWQLGGQGKAKQPRPKINGSQNRAREEKHKVKNQQPKQKGGWKSSW